MLEMLSLEKIEKETVAKYNNKKLFTYHKYCEKYDYINKTIFRYGYFF
jgi:hypothetical protein